MTRSRFRRIVVLAVAVLSIGPSAVAAWQNAKSRRADEPPAQASVAARDAEKSRVDPTSRDPLLRDPLAAKIQPGEWNQWGGSPLRNNTPEGKNVLTDWKVGELDENTDTWKNGTAKNVKWVARLGSHSYGNPVVANGKVFVGTNNVSGYLKRYTREVDLGILLCFNEADGKFLWQDSSEKLSTGRVNDWPLQGICSTPLVEGHRLWYVTSRGEVKCLDTDARKPGTTDEPNVIWTFDMMTTLGVRQHNMCNCSATAAGDLLFVNTSQGVDVDHNLVPAPSAPSFLCLDKNNGTVIWADNSPGKNILHGQWSSPAYAVLGGVPQVIFGGGDGYLYSFLGSKENENGRPKRLWKFDCNPKESKYRLGGRSDRNHIIGTPVIYDGRIYVGVGDDPEHAEGIGHFWCVDPTKRGDVSAELAFNVKDLEHPIPHHRTQAVVRVNGEVARPNPNSAAVWHYDHYDLNHNCQVEFDETMHRTCGTAAIKKNLVFIPDFSGILHCLDAKTGKPHWTYDLYSACWGSCLIVEDKVYVGNENGDVFIFKLSPKMELLSKKSDGSPGGIEMVSSVYGTPIVAHNVLYVSNGRWLFAIAPPSP